MTANDWIIDPKIQDFSSFGHFVGNNEFDSDMNIVESLVRAHNNPSDKLAQASVFNYYISRILDYLNFTKEYVYSPEVAEEYKVIFRSSKKKSPPSLEELENYQEEVMNLVESLTENFGENGTYDIVLICHIFEYIAVIACWSTPDLEIISERAYGSHTYPLPNTVGFFGLNTYLYAYFNDVYLIGVPKRVQTYDFERGCPQAFIEHDLDHTEAIYQDTQEMSDNFNKYLYYTIVNDLNLTMKQKECHITNLWCLIHEASTEEYVRHGISLRQIDDDTGRHLEEIAFTVPVTLLWSIYQTFSDFIVSDDNVGSLMNYLGEYPEYAETKGDIEKSIKGSFDTDPDKINFFYLALWYSQRYIFDLYARTSKEGNW